MTNSTRGDVAAICGAAGRVAGITLIVCADGCGNTEAGCRTTAAAMTAVATGRWTRLAREVLCVIKTHIETLVECARKILKRWFRAVNVCMTDDAHWNCGRYELSRVTANA